MTQETDEANQSRSFEYDAMGNPTKMTDRDGRVTRYVYDADGRQIAELWRNALDTATVRTISYTYDVAGELVSVSDCDANSVSISDTDYVYDELGRATSIAATIAGLTPSVVLTQTYDAAGNRLTLATTLGSTDDLLNTYLYDNLGRLKQVAQSSPAAGDVVAPKRVDFTYNAASQWSTIARYASLDATELVATGTYGYDSTGRLRSLGYTDPQSVLLVSHGWTFDAAGNITAYVNSIDGTVDYENDSTGQLTEADYDGLTPDEGFSYDSNGNRTNTGYTTGVCNRMTSDGTFSYQYDAEGNRTVRTRISTDPADDYTTEYTWDYRNRLTAVTFKNKDSVVTKTVAYTYDVFDRLIGRVVTSGGTTHQTRFIYDGTQILAQFDGTGDGSGVGTGNDVLTASALSHRYLWNPQAVDQLLADETVSSPSAAGSVVWPLVDHLNTARDLAVHDDQTQVTTIANHRVYSAYGEPVSETAPTVDCVFGFTGRYFDEATGLQYNWHRWYDPKTGGWIGEDPIGFVGEDTNLSRYVGNSTTIWADPSGLAKPPGKWHFDPRDHGGPHFQRTVGGVEQRYRAPELTPMERYGVGSDTGSGVFVFPGERYGETCQGD